MQEPAQEPTAASPANHADGTRKDPTAGMNRHQRRKWEAEHRHEAGKQRARKNRNDRP
jgi:hypothetical protein